MCFHDLNFMYSLSARHFRFLIRYLVSMAWIEEMEVDQGNILLCHVQNDA